MKYIALLCGALAMPACTELSELSSRSADLPGIPTTIDCNPEPQRVFSKSGDLIEVRHPVLHPSCTGEVLGQVAVKPGLFEGWTFGPPTYSPGKVLEATDDDVAVAQVTPDENSTVTGNPNDDAPAADTPVTQPSAPSKLDQLKEHASRP